MTTQDLVDQILASAKNPDRQADLAEWWEVEPEPLNAPTGHTASAPTGTAPEPATPALPSMDEVAALGLRTLIDQAGQGSTSAAKTLVELGGQARYANDDIEGMTLKDLADEAKKLAKLCESLEKDQHDGS